MNRRNFMGAAAAGGLAGAATAATAKNAIIELTRFQLRTSQDNQRQRTMDYLKNGMLPAVQRAGIGPVGFFTSSIAPESPFILCVLSFPGMSAAEAAMAKLGADKEYEKAYEEFNSPTSRSFERIENSLLLGFDGFPNIVVPPTEAKRPPRLFELRTYESPTGTTLRRKIKMFEDAEIAIFKRCGLLPIFFGQTIVGRNRPNLTYMVAYDDWASREKVWSTFGSDPEWKKLRAQPELSDAAIVSNISNALLTPLPFSPIR